MSDSGQCPDAPNDLRRALIATAAAGLAGVIAGCRSGESGGDEAEVSPPEDLMREHGVLSRILLVYEEGIQRLQSAPKDLPPPAIRAAADIVRRFVEEYHERLEETHLFPRFEKAGRLTELVATLRAQHRSGRRMTDDIRRLASDTGLAESVNREALADALRRFIRMYRPHAAREDTVLFPALRRIVTAHEFGALGEEFERREHEIFGDEGFERIVDEVAGLERQLGIDDLNRVTA